MPTDPRPQTTPFYKRALDSFDDEVITRTRPAEDGRRWYAVLDVGPEQWPSDPDFSRCAATREDAIRHCAHAIRQDAKGIGKYAPHDLLVSGYHLHWRLAKHWAAKEAANAR